MKFTLQNKRRGEKFCHEAAWPGPAFMNEAAALFQM